MPEPLATAPSQSRLSRMSHTHQVPLERGGRLSLHIFSLLSRLVGQPILAAPGFQPVRAPSKEAGGVYAFGGFEPCYGTPNISMGEFFCNVYFRHFPTLRPEQGFCACGLGLECLSCSTESRRYRQSAWIWPRPPPDSFFSPVCGRPSPEH